MKSTNTKGLSILAGGLAFVGSANATDLIVNGSFEAGPGVGWVGDFGTYSFSAAYFAGPPIPAAEGPADVYSWRHGISGNNFSGPLTQQVDLLAAASAADIDAGRGSYTFSAWLASYTQDPERPYVTVQFFDSSGTTQIGSTVALDRTSAQNFVRFANGVTVFDRTTHEHHWAKYQRSAPVPPGARFARVGVTRSPNAGLAGRPDTYTDLVKLDVITVPYVPPSVDSAEPTGFNVRPDAAINISLVDGSAQVNTNSIQLTYDGAPVSPAIAKSGPNTTIQYDPPGLLAAGSAHNYRLIFSDNSVVPVSQTNVFNFNVSSYYHILLPSPLHFENFDGTAEGSLPSGWTELSYSDVPDPACDPLAAGIGGLQDLNSACYAKWTTVNSARFNDPMFTYLSHTLETDYRRVLTPNLANVVNGAVIGNLAQGNIAFGDSGYRDGNNQVVYLFSPDFDCSAKNNIYLSFHSIWEQNQDSIGAVEYSIDEGATWLPVVYYLESADVVRDADGNADGAATFAAAQSDTASYTDPVEGFKGGSYGVFIGVDSARWSSLGPFIKAGQDDNPTQGKRVEVFRLPAADNQAKVRFRFAHAGTDSWYFGLDNVGLYQLTSVAPPLVTITPTNAVEYLGNSMVFSSSVVGIGPFSYQWQRNGTDLPDETNTTLVVSAVSTNAAGTYTLRVGYPGGNTTASVPLTVLDARPAQITGQWDFNFYNLVATVGRDLEFYDDYSLAGSLFTDSDFEELPPMNGEYCPVLKFPGGDAFTRMSGYIMPHGIPANGGGTKVNQYTLIMDVLYMVNAVERALLQTTPDNSDNRDIAIGANNGIGSSGGFQGNFLPDTWQRIAFAVDLSGPGSHPVMAKFINGVKVGQQVLSEGLDGRWSLFPADHATTPWALLFADDNVEAQPGYVSSIQIRNGRLSDAQIARLGGPSAKKIPGPIRLAHNAGQVVIEWTGGVPLQSAENVTGPWTDVPGATSPYSVPTPLGPRKFFRPKL